MIRNRLIANVYPGLNLLRTSRDQQQPSNQRQFQTSKFVHSNNQRTQWRRQTDLPVESTYVERNDNLLSLDEVFRQIDQKRKDNAQVTSDRKNAKKPLPKTTHHNDEIRFIEDITNVSSNRLALDGKNLINDVIQYDYPKLIRIYFSGDDKLAKIHNLDMLRKKGVEFVRVQCSLMKQHSDVITPQGVIGVVEVDVRELYERNMKKNEHKAPLILVLNNVKDPGNMGTLIRSSLACGINKILCLKGCAKLLKNKVIRSTAGSIFHMPFVEELTAQELKNHVPSNAKIYLSDSKGSNFDPNLRDLLENDGIAENTDNIVKKTAFSSSSEQSETVKLNEQKSTVEENSFESISEHEVEECVQQDKKTVIDITADLSESIERVRNMKLRDYFDVKFFSKPDDCVVLITNGESGLTEDILDLIKTRDCTKINIPLDNQVDSLNSSVAASILMYEIRRQYCQSLATKQ